MNIVQSPVMDLVAKSQLDTLFFLYLQKYKIMEALHPIDIYFAYTQSEN